MILDIAAPRPAAAPVGAARMSFRKGGEIHGQGEEAAFLYRVVSGAVRTTRLLADGRRQIADFHHRGDFFGLERGERHRFAAEALGDCVIEVIRRSALETPQAEALRADLWAATRRDFERAQDHLMLLNHMGARERVLGFLSDIAERQGGGPADLPMGRQDIADYLGLTIETVSRMVTLLQAEGRVAFQGSRRFALAATPNDRLAA